MMRTCFLVLENGLVFRGRPCGSEPVSPAELVHSGRVRRTAGELVFNTGMTGYPEILTDPSYTGQIVMMTSPHIGNYGIDPSWSETGPGLPAGDIQPSGFVVRSLYTGPSASGRISLDEYLRAHGVTGIWDVDTRALTLHIRSAGNPRALITGPDSPGGELSAEGLALCRDYLENYPKMEGLRLVDGVGCASMQDASTEGRPFIIVLDTGVKAGIIRSLTQRGCRVRIAPPTCSAEELLAENPDGILPANGPGDPGVLLDIIAEIQKLVGKVPLFGICLGHQLLALALGAETVKMKFGHHGCNHPVRNEVTGRVYVTSQNHGFMVDETSLPHGIDVWFRNANDGSIEGLRCDTLGILSVQFHPEAAPGPRETGMLFDDFLAGVNRSRDRKGVACAGT